MQKIRTLGSKPAAAVVMLVLLGITAHAAVIPLIEIITNRDDFNARAGRPDRTYNFDNLGDGFTNIINFGDLRITGDILVQSRAINFSAPGSLAFNFSGNIAAWGADIQSIGGPGLINFTVSGLSRTALINFSSPGFAGFYFPAFAGSQFNVTFSPLGSILTADGPNVSFLIDNVIATTAVPEPSTLLLLSAGAGLYGLAARRRKQLGTRDNDGSPNGPSDPA
jgi:hypothetical protein